MSSCSNAVFIILISMSSDNHVVYLECVRPDIGKKGMNKYYYLARYDDEVHTKYGSIGPKDSEGVPFKGTKEVKTFANNRQAEAFLIKKMRSKTNPSGTMKDTKTGRTIPNPPYKVVMNKRGVVDLKAIRGRLGILNHSSFDTV